MDVKEFQFKGKNYLISCWNNYPPDSALAATPHPTWYTFQDESEVRDRNWNIKPGDVILDIGAAFGSYTLTALSQFAQFVYAWAPQGCPGEESEKAVLESSLALNKWQDKCEILTTGFWDKAGWLNTETLEFSETPKEGLEIIQVETLDAWFERENPSRIDWMKLDVEGAEAKVLQFGKKLIIKFKPKILVENHQFKVPTAEQEVRAILVELGYQEISTLPYHGVSHSFYLHPENSA
jgi:FkbM family methyltransferase